MPKTAGTAIENILALGSPIQGYGGHSTALGIKKHFPLLFRKYYKFAFVRNPYTRIASAYFYLKNIKGGGEHQNDLILLSKNINDYIENYLLKESIIHLWPQFHFLTGVYGNILVDNIFKFENLDEEWSRICNKLNINYSLPHIRVSQKENYILSPNSIKIINSFYEKDFKLFGYKMESNYI